MSASVQAAASRSATSRTCIWGQVTVPVLSTHSTSTRARVSMAFISWISVRFRASRTTLTARATLVRRNSPSGIMPMRAATVDTTDCRSPRSWVTNWV